MKSCIFRRSHFIPSLLLASSCPGFLWWHSFVAAALSKALVCNGCSGTFLEERKYVRNEVLLFLKTAVGGMYWWSSAWEYAAGCKGHLLPVQDPCTARATPPDQSPSLQTYCPSWEWLISAMLCFRRNRGANPKSVPTCFVELAGSVLSQRRGSPPVCALR